MDLNDMVCNEAVIHHDPGFSSWTIMTWSVMKQ